MTVTNQISIQVSSGNLKEAKADYGRVTVSLGAAQPGAQEQARGLTQRADSALYQAKKQGRDHVVGGG